MSALNKDGVFASVYILEERGLFSAELHTGDDDERVTEEHATIDALLHVVARMIADKGDENGNEG